MLPPNDHVDHLWTGWKLPSPASLGRHKKKRQKNRYYIIKKKILHLIRIEHERVSRYFSRHFPSISLHRFGSMTEYDASSFFFFSSFLFFLLLTISVRRSRVAQERDEWLLMRLDSFYTDVVSLPIGHPSLEDCLVAACNRRLRPPHIIDEPTQFLFDILSSFLVFFYGYFLYLTFIVIRLWARQPKRTDCNRGKAGCYCCC